MNDMKTSKTQTLLEVVMYAFCGPFMCLASLFADFYYFMGHLYMSNNEKLTTYRAQKISINYMLTMLQTAKEEIKKEEQPGKGDKGCY